MYDYFGKGPGSTHVINYLKTENAYLDTMMEGAKKLKENLFNEMKARIKEKDESVKNMLITTGLHVRFDYLKKVALNYAFLLKLEGID